MERVFLFLASCGGFLGVALGAFGAHSLKSHLGPERLALWEKGVQYQFVHVLALLAVAWLATRFPAGPWKVAGACFAGGILLFSGSLYLLALTGSRPWGAVTPVGGVLFLAGWACLVGVAWKGAGV